MCGKVDLERVEKWYKHKPGEVIENEGYKIFWDMNILFEQVIEARRKDIVFINKEKHVKIINVLVPGYIGTKDKVLEKIEKYLLLKDEMNMKRV